MDRPAHPIRFSFPAKVLAPVLGFLVLLPMITLWIVNRHISQQVQDQARQTLATAEAVFLNSLEIRSRNLVSRFRNVVNEPRFKAVSQLGDSKTMTAYLRDSLDELGDENEVILFTVGQGQLLAGARRDSTIPLEEFGRAAAGVTQTALNGEVGAGVIWMNRRTFNVVSVPALVSDKGPLVGVLTIGVRIGETAVQELKSLTRTEILLLADTGVTASTIPPSGLDATMLQQISALDENPGEAARPHQIQPVVVNGEHYLALAGSYERKGPQRGFRYLLLSSDESQLRALAQTRATLVGVSLAGILLSGMIVWFFIRRITRPLLELRDSAEAIGRGDFSRRIERFSNDECGELAVAFNHMIQNLQSSRAELEKTVTTLHATQAQLVQSEKLSAVGQFVAGVAHELNNPLTIVIGYSDLMKQMGLGDQLQKYLDQIGKSAQRCHKIVQNLLSFARQHTPERRPVNINELCDAVAEILVYDLRTSNIEIRKNYQTDLPPILGDPHQLQQVFLNIINNARQAIEAFRHDGQILLTTRSLGPQVELRIKDNGPGISRENLSRIFDPFFTTKPIGKGTGLGLSLSYGIIQEHHGKISVESQPGAGAEFIILFPVAADGGVTANDVRKPSSPPFPPLQGAGQTVLVVDDEEWILSLVQELLTREGYTVETVSSGQAALELLGRKGYDLIISDWKMPGLSGLQIYESLLSRDPAMARRILFMTGDVISESFKGFLQKYSRACLPKPFSLREFQAAVTRMTAGS